jgi:phosphoribosyl 1,2-cyclic phosphate phosphodiesterase
MRFVPVPLWHGRMPVLGFRTGDFAYLTDCNRLDAAAWPCSTDSTRWCSTALRDKPHSTHFTLEESWRWCAVSRRAAVSDPHDPRPGPRGHECAPARGVQLAYDGLVLEVAVSPA